ncbi:Uncharacterised protein [uncultured archaeon]|nr:Uncharacterised protein [uncultured archaeon]
MENKQAIQKGTNTAQHLFPFQNQQGLLLQVKGLDKKLLEETLNERYAIPMVEINAKKNPDKILCYARHFVENAEKNVFEKPDAKVTDVLIGMENKLVELYAAGLDMTGAVSFIFDSLYSGKLGFAQTFETISVLGNMMFTRGRTLSRYSGDYVPPKQDIVDGLEAAVGVIEKSDALNDKERATIMRKAYEKLAHTYSCYASKEGLKFSDKTLREIGR